MLNSLHVKNMALIQETEVEFGEGLNILSGETGAGKSIIIGSVNIALGSGNFRDFVRENAEYSLAELVFSTDSETVRAEMEELGIPWEDGEIIISRRFKGGRSVSRINGETVPVSAVRRLALGLIDIHGQHEHQSLLSPAKHLEILDAFAGDAIREKKELCRKQYRSYMAVKKEWDQALRQESDRLKEMDFLRFEVQELEAAALRPGEDEELEQEYRLLSNGQKIMEALSEAGNLSGCGGYGGAAEEIGKALRCISSVQEYDSALDSLGESLGEIESLLNDFNRALSDYMDEFSFDAREQSRVEERLDLINRLKAKYGSTIQKILEGKKEREERLALLENYEEYLGKLEGRYEEAKKALERTADEITVLRQENARRLERLIKENLVDLNFLDVQFEISFRILASPGENGRDEISFLISTNPGMPLRPLKDVASGGELSRIMLAIKAVLADQDDVGTLIFDEIDTGISGRTAQKVSEKMAVLSSSRQIICITHLAQIASMADHHFLIEKRPEAGKTRTEILPLTEEESVQELARILGGARITETVLDSAREMKEMAKKLKNPKGV